MVDWGEAASRCSSASANVLVYYHIGSTAKGRNMSIRRVNCCVVDFVIVCIGFKEQVSACDAIVCDVVTATPTYPATFDWQLAMKLLCVGLKRVCILYWPMQIISQH